MDTTHSPKNVVKEQEKGLKTKWDPVYAQPIFGKQILKGLLDLSIDGHLSKLYQRSYDQAFINHDEVKLSTSKENTVYYFTNQLVIKSSRIMSYEKIDTSKRIRKDEDNVMVISLQVLKKEFFERVGQKKINQDSWTLTRT